MRVEQRWRPRGAAAKQSSLTLTQRYILGSLIAYLLAVVFEPLARAVGLRLLKKLDQLGAGQQSPANDDEARDNDEARDKQFYRIHRRRSIQGQLTAGAKAPLVRGGGVVGCQI